MTQHPLNPQQSLSRSFWLVIAAKQLSLFGTTIANIALNWFLLSQTGLASSIGKIQGSSLFLLLLLTPLLAPLGDRYSKKLLSIIGSTWSGLTYIAIAFLIMLGDFKREHDFLLLICFFLLSTIGQACTNAGSAGMIPAVIKKESLARGIRLDSFFTEITSTISSPIGGILVSIFPALAASFLFKNIALEPLRLGTIAIMLINALAFFLFSLLLLFARVRRTKREEKRGSAFSTWAMDLKEGALFVAKLDTFVAIFLLFMMGNFAASAFTVVGVPYIIKEVAKLESWFLGLYNGVFGLGAVCGLLILGLLNKKKISNFKTLVITFWCNPFFTFLSGVFLVKYPMAALVTAFLDSACEIILSTILIIQIQLVLTDAIRTRVTTVVTLICRISMPVGVLVGGVIIDSYSYWILIYVVAFAMLVMAFALFFVPGIKEFASLEAKDSEHFVLWRTEKRDMTFKQSI